MPYPNTVLSAWQLAVIAVVAVGTLVFWLVAVYLAARPPRRAPEAATSGASPAVAEAAEDRVAA